MPLVILLVHVVSLRQLSQSSIRLDMISDTINIPFLGAVNDIMLSILTFDGCRCDVGDIAASVGLGNGDAAPLLAAQQLGEEALLEVLAAELDDGRHAEGHARSQTAAGAREAAAGHLVGVDDGVQVIKVLNAQAAQQLVDAQPLQPLDGEGRRQRGDQHAGGGELAEDVRGHCLGPLPLLRVRQQVLLDEGADGGLPLAVGFLVDGRGQTHQPRRLAEGDGGTHDVFVYALALRMIDAI